MKILKVNNKERLKSIFDDQEISVYEKKKEIGKSIKNRRLELNMTLEELADNTMISSVTLMDYEMGEFDEDNFDQVVISAELVRLLNYLNVKFGGHTTQHSTSKSKSFNNAYSNCEKTVLNNHRHGSRWIKGSNVAARKLEPFTSRRNHSKASSKLSKANNFSKRGRRKKFKNL